MNKVMEVHISLSLNYYYGKEDEMVRYVAYFLEWFLDLGQDTHDGSHDIDESESLRHTSFLRSV